MNNVPADLPGAEALAHLSSRKDFLKMAGAAGLGVALGSNIMLRGAFALDPPGPTDPSFSFSIEADYSAFDVISDNFVEHRDGFDRNQKLYRVLTPAPEGTQGSLSVKNAVCRSVVTPRFSPCFEPASPQALRMRRLS